jgi:hypothetical protein
LLPDIPPPLLPPPLLPPPLLLLQCSIATSAAMLNKG